VAEDVAIICDWKKGDYSHENQQLQLYAMCLRERYTKIQWVHAYQFYLQPYKKDRYYDYWTLTTEDLDATKKWLRGWIEDIRSSFTLEAWPCAQACTKEYGHGCSYYKDCPHAWGKDHYYERYSEEVPRIWVRENLVQWMMDKPQDIINGFQGMEDFLSFANEYKDHPVWLEDPFRDSKHRGIWCNNLKEAADWLTTILRGRFAKELKGVEFSVSPIGMVVFKHTVS